MPRRVLFLAYRAGLGGGERFLLNLLARLDRSRFEPMLVTAEPGELAVRAGRLGVPTEVLPLSNQGGLGKARALAAAARLHQLMRKRRVDVLHLNDIEMGKYGALAARALGVPVVWTCHGWWYAGRAREWFYRGFIRRTAAVSSAVAEALTARGLLSSRQVSIIHPGVDVAEFAPAEDAAAARRTFGIEPSARVVGIVGRFQPIKGHRLFLAAARRVAEAVPQAHFLVAGANVFGVPEEERYRQSLVEEVAADPLLRERTTFSGFVDDVPRLMGALDVLVSASEAETFGLVHLEAMACARPVVTTDSRGPRDTVVEGESGYFVPHEPAPLAERIVTLLGDEALRVRMGRAGRARAEAHFSLEAMARHYQAIYDELPKVHR